jgi:DNA-binding response OmpR family regulator
MARVLIVEDDRFFAEALARTLGLAGHEVAVAGGAREGVRRGEEYRPDVLVAVWCLKGDVDGGEVCRRIHAACPAVRAIVITAHPERTFEAAHCSECVEAVLIKPFHKNEILEAVRRAAAGTAGFASAPSPVSSFSRPGDSCQLLARG